MNVVLLRYISVYTCRLEIGYFAKKRYYCMLCLISPFMHETIIWNRGWNNWVVVFKQLKLFL